MRMKFHLGLICVACFVKADNVITGQEQFKNIIESLPHNTMITKQNADIILHSKTIDSILNESIVGENFLAIVQQRFAFVSKETCVTEFEMAVKTQKVRAFHARSKLTQILYHVQMVPVMNEDMMLVTADEVAYLDNEKALLSTLDSYQLFKQMVESIKDYAIFMLDPDGYVITWNKGAEKLKLFKEKEILGKHFSLFYTLEDIEKNKPARNLEMAVREGRCENEDWRLRADGSSFLANVIISPVYNDDKKLKGFVKITQDLTHRVQIQQHIDTEVSEKSDTLRVSFLAHVSHELRNVMHSMSIATDLIDKTEVSEKQRPFVDILLQNNLLLNQLLNDILDYSRSGATGVELTNECVDIIQLTNNVVRPLQLINSKEIKINVEIADDVPREVITDKTRLTQILSNILNNAMKFTEHGSIVLTLNMCENVNENVLLQFAIVDTGIGVQADQLSRLFVPFSQSKLQGNQYGGTGLGLAICKQLVEAMGGNIEMHSVFGKGTKVTFSIQVAPTTSINEPMTTISRRGSSWLSEDVLQQAKILIVEDNSINQLLLKRLLVHLGLLSDHVQLANDGEVAVTMTRHFLFDLVFMDLNMERMGGIEATHIIRQYHPLLPIYAMTANGFESDRRRCHQVGMNGFILKPLKKDVLKSVLFNVLSQ